MNKSEITAKKINKVLKSTITNGGKLIVGIDGYAGSGKTTITRKLRELNKDIEIVHLDDFIKHFKSRKKLMESTKYKPSVFEYNWYRYSDLAKLIKEFKRTKTGKLSYKIYDFKANEFDKKLKEYNASKKILVVDGIFLLHPHHKVNRLFDFSIYLDSQKERADKRRVARDKKEYGKDFLADDHPDNWVNYYKKAYLGYIKNHKPHKNADVVFKV